MSEQYRQLMSEVAQSTEPGPAMVARVRERLDAQLAPTTDLLRALPEPSSLQVQRVRARLGERERSSAHGRRAYGPRILAGAVGLGLAAAAVAVVAMPAAPVDLALGAESVAISKHVRLAPSGVGAVTGQGETFAVTWENGDLGVDVTPNAGVDLSVTTPEAVVRVVGTGFDVTRGKLGTTVVVQRGRVSVDCVLGDDATLGQGGSHTCWPVTAAGLLGRAQALSEGQASADHVLAALELGMGRADATGAVRGELLVASLAPLVAAGRQAEALDHAEAYLAEGGARPEIRRYAARLALTVSGCDRALPHLSALSDRTAEEDEALARCSAP